MHIAHIAMTVSNTYAGSNAHSRVALLSAIQYTQTYTADFRLSNYHNCTIAD